MNPFTELVWDSLGDSPELLEQLSAIMKREYKPFLTGAQAFQANTTALEHHLREELDKWYEWLPDTSINRIGGGLAVGIIDLVDWDQVGRLVLENTLRANLAALQVPHPSRRA